MAGEIKHTWVGTTLIIESDSGTSAMDLKGATGDTGPRGPQGPAGVIYGNDGEVAMEGYATEQYVQDLLREVNDDITQVQTNVSDCATKQELQDAIDEIPKVDLTGYATEDYVTEQIEEAQLGSSQTDLSNYVTKQELADAINGIPDVSGEAF